VSGADPLLLLSLSPEATRVVQQLATWVRQDDEHPGTIVDLLGRPGWRDHLPGAVAVLLSPRSGDLCGAMWGAIERGSWVSPQLAVALSRCDAQFVARARERISAGCPITPPRLDSVLLQHVVTGTSVREAHSAKEMTALLYLLRTIGDAEWAKATSHLPLVAHCVERDRDQGHRIAAFWSDALQERLSELNEPCP
jgi:hypothetical protein